MLEKIYQSRETFRVRHALLPDKATSLIQLELSAKHGTPLAFSEACGDSIGEVSWDEAEEAVQKYLVEWNRAAQPPEA